MVAQIIMKTKLHHPFNADRPIDKIENDLLGRADIARSIATAIKNWKGQDALVMALYGGWGDGKSSLKGMVVNALKNEVNECPFIVVFNPWEWSDSQQLVRAFFDEIASQIASQGFGTDKIQTKRSAAALKKLGKYLSFGGSFFDSLSYGTASWSLKTSFAANLLGKVFKKSGEISQKASEAAEESQSQKDSGLLSIKKELRTALSELNRPVLVLIDDVDRLAAEEVKLLFQLVKANSDFPNLIFFMLFQRDIIENCLEKTMQSGNGRAFLEKIIQVGLQLPQIQQPMLDNYLEKRLDEVLARYHLEKNFDKDRWRETYANCLSPYFKNLRDINRFFSTFEFLIPLFIKPVLEVNLVDLFALEVLRVFQPDAYNAIANCRSILWGDGKSFSVENYFAENPNNTAEKRKRVFELLPSDPLQRGPSVFDELFQLNGSRGNNAQFAQDLRVCSQEYFDRYFKWCVPKGDLSQADLNELHDNLGNREKLKEKLLQLNSASLGLVALERLGIHAKRFQQADAEAFATALFDVGDQFAHTPNPPNYQNNLLNLAIRLIQAHLCSVADPNIQFGILQRAMAASEGLYLPVIVANRELHTNTQIGNKEGSLSDDMRKKLTALNIGKIKTAAQKGSLEKHPRLDEILLMWKTWGDSADVRQFFNTIVKKQPLVLLHVLFKPGPEPVSEITDQNDFLDLDSLNTSIKDLKSDLTTKQERALCDHFEKLYDNYRRKQSIPSNAAVALGTS
jgi:predicted KAP-like P-loop ATPase